MRTRPHGRASWAAVAAAGVVLLGGCGAGQLSQAASSGGVSVDIGTIQLRDAVITYNGPVPGDTVYDVGQDAPLQVTIVNNETGAVDEPPVDRLLAVSSPIATSGRIVGDTTITGGQVLVAGYDEPISSITLPDSTAIEIVLIGLTEPIRAGLNYPVEFTFEHAGTVRLQLPVEYADIPAPRASDDDPPTEDRTLTDLRSS